MLIKDLRLAECSASESTIPSYAFVIHALEGRLMEFFLAVANTVLSATTKYAAPATTNRMRELDNCVKQ